MERASRLAQLSDRLSELDADVFLITRPPNVRYLTGFSGSNGQFLVTPQGAVFLTDTRYAEAARRVVPDLPHLIYSGSFLKAVRQACEELGARRVAFETEGLTYGSWASLRDADLHLLPASGEVERLRLVKSPEEIELISQAQAIADDAFEAITGKLTEGVTERQVAFELETFMRQATADGIAFDTILAFGESAAEPHHHRSDRPLARGDVVTIDFGCVVQGYHSDMTRTLAYGEPPARMREIYEVVQRAQQAGLDATRAGVTGGEMDSVVRGIVADAGYGEAFSHGLGHGVGLEIHEDPFLRPGSQEVVPDGAIVTVEPGVYLPGEGGVRIEDMVEVTADGGRVIPRTPKDLIVL